MARQFLNDFDTDRAIGERGDKASDSSEILKHHYVRLIQTWRINDDQNVILTIKVSPEIRVHKSGYGNRRRGTRANA
jgi:hypothetical protein